MSNFLITVGILLICCNIVCLALNDGLHRTPPMGWSSWNTFFRENDEQKMKGIADSMVRLKLNDFGYTILTVDDYWNLPERDPDGNMQVNTTRFPSGMRNLSDYIHNLGLKFGIYSDAGAFTCGGCAGSLGHEEKDVQLFLDYQIDYLKYDNCYPNGNDTNIGLNNIDFKESFLHLPSFYQSPPERERFEPMANALKDVKHIRNISFELCLYGFGNVEVWGPDFGHLWRTGYDMEDKWRIVLRNLDRNDEQRFWNSQGAEVGSWNYPDALFVQNGGMNVIEYRTMFALWCAIKSPLMIGSDLRNMEIGDPGHQTLTNEELIAINQDPLGVQAKCKKDCCSEGLLGAVIPAVTCRHFRNSWQVWQGPLSNDSFVVIILNRFEEEAEINLDWKVHTDIPPGDYILRDLWDHEDIEEVNIYDTYASPWSRSLSAHDHFALKLTPIIGNSVTITTKLNLWLLTFCSILLSFY